jgi:hypothetical protein
MSYSYYFGGGGGASCLTSFFGYSFLTYGLFSTFGADEAADEAASTSFTLYLHKFSNTQFLMK